MIQTLMQVEEVEGGRVGWYGVWEEGGRGDEVGVWPGVSEDYFEEGGRYDRMLGEEQSEGEGMQRG